MGTADKVREDVKWLLTQSRFMYDELDLQVWLEIYSNPLSNFRIAEKNLQQK